MTKHRTLFRVLRGLAILAALALPALWSSVGFAESGCHKNPPPITGSR